MKLPTYVFCTGLVVIGATSVAVAHGGEVHHTETWLRMPPLHPILVHFPIALVPAALLSDLIAQRSKEPQVRTSGAMMLFFAAFVAPFAAAAGWYWAASMPMAHWQMEPHRILGTAIAVVLPLIAWWRWKLNASDGSLPWIYFAGLLLLNLAMLIQGFLGGDMTFMSHERREPSLAQHQNYEHAEAETSGDVAVTNEHHHDHDHGESDHH